MKSLAWLVAAFVLIAGAAAIVVPERVLSLRPLEASQVGLLVVAVIRIAMGVILIMAAPSTRAPKIFQLLGALFLGAGLATPLFGVERAKAMLEWEAAQGTPLMRALGVVVVALGGGLAFALTPRKPA